MSMMSCTDMFSAHATVQDALEDVIAPSSDGPRRKAGLTLLEEMLATACCSDPPNVNYLDRTFVALQDTFECNIPSRLLPWIASCTPRFEVLLKDSPRKQARGDVTEMADHLHQSLVLLQGIALVHPPSKRFLSRPYCLRILLELFLASRHQPSTATPTKAPNTSSSPSNLFLSATILDSLLCILVDSPQAIRTFEDVGGVQSVVRLLKRVGTPREVRMKALEFLYFYLMDEDSPGEIRLDVSMDVSSPSSQTSRLPSLLSENSPIALPITSQPSVMVTSPSAPQTTSHLTPPPSTPRHTPRSSTSRTGSGHIRSQSLHSGLSKQRSNSHSSSDSSGSASSQVAPKTPPTSTDSSPQPSVAKPRDVLLLRGDVEYTPISPAKPLTSDSGSGKPGINGASPRLPGMSHSRHRSDATSAPPTPASGGGRSPLSGAENRPSRDGTQGSYIRVRSSEEKKAILGDLLGNVDQLVERARKAGIWDAA